MRQRCVPTQGSAAWQSFTFRPQDPVWAPHALLERTRKALKAYDTYLDLWWSPMRQMHSGLAGRWRIVAFMPKTSTWDTVLYWEGEGGTYRDPSPEGCLMAAQKADLWARGDDLKKLSDRLETKSKKNEDAAWREKYDGTWDHSVDVAEFAAGHKKHYDMGVPTP